MRLKEFREKAGLTQFDACVAIGTSIATLNRWENGVSRVPADIVQTLAKVYHTTELEILEALKNRESA